MEVLFDTIRMCFQFFDNTSVMGLSLTTWIIIVLVITIISIFIRGNK